MSEGWIPPKPEKPITAQQAAESQAAVVQKAISEREILTTATEIVNRAFGGDHAKNQPKR